MQSFLPVGFMESVIVPIVKNARENISSKDNYRPITLTSTLSKIIEKIILARYSSLLQTTENQFGFKSNSSTDLCIFSLKQVIDYYRNNGSPVYLCFLDASKAFDRVPHNILFSKLFERKVPHIVIRLLVYGIQHKRLQSGGTMYCLIPLRRPMVSDKGVFYPPLSLVCI